MQERRRSAWIGGMVVVRGTVVATEDLVIDGQVHGTIELGDHNLTISKIPMPKGVTAYYKHDFSLIQVYMAKDAAEAAADAADKAANAAKDAKKAAPAKAAAPAAKAAAPAAKKK